MAFIYGTISDVSTRFGEILSMDTLLDKRIVIFGTLALIYLVCLIIDPEDV